MSNADNSFGNRHMSRLDLYPQLKKQKKDLNPGFGVYSASGILVNMIVGSSLFSAPSLVAQQVGSTGMALCLWAIGLLLTFCGAAGYIEWGLLLPKNGGELLYLAFSFPGYSFIVPFMYSILNNFVVAPGMICSSARVAVLNLMRLTPYRAFDSEEATIKIGMILLIFLGLLVNLFRKKFIAILQNLGNLFKILFTVAFLTVGILAAAGLFQSKQVSVQAITFDKTSTFPSNHATGLIKVFFSYMGWNSLNSVISDLRDPLITFPKATYIGITISAVIYTLVSLIYYLFVPFDVLIANSETIGAEFFELTLGSVAGTYIVPIFVGISMWITCTCNIFVFSRTLESAARENLFPMQQLLLSRNRFEMPYITAIITSLVAICFTLFMPSGNGLNFMIDAASYPHWISTGVVIGTLIYIRTYHEEIISPYTSWMTCLYSFFFGAIFIVVFPMFKNTNEGGDYDSRYPILVMVGVVIVGLGLFYKIRKTVLVNAFLIREDIVNHRMSKFV